MTLFASSVFKMVASVSLLALMAALVAQMAGSNPALQTRTYWPVNLDSLALKGTVHTHIEVTGTVSLVRKETDGDLHIRLVSPGGHFVVAECIPALPCVPPKLGQIVTVRGISRYDPEHRWWEIHVVEGIRIW